MTTGDSADAEIASDLPCRGCGYLLRGLRANSICPECALPIAESLRAGAGLEHADTRWLGRLAIGSWVIFIAAPLWVGAKALGIVQKMVIVEALGLIPAVLHVIGYWLVSSPEPGVSGFGKVRLARVAIRVFALLYLAVVVLRLPAIADASGGGRENLYIIIGYTIAGYICIGWTAATFVYFKDLAKRMESSWMARVLGLLGLLPILLAACSPWGWSRSSSYVPIGFK